MIKKETILKQGEGIVLREVAGEQLLIPVRGQLADLQNLYVLEGVAASVWNKLDGLRNLSAIAAEVALEYRKDASTVFEDCTEFLEGLKAAGLVECAS